MQGTDENARLIKRHNLPFVILNDERGELTNHFGLLHENGGPAGEDVAIPALIFFDENGRVSWRHTSTRVHDRLSSEEILRAIRPVPE